MKMLLRLPWVLTGLLALLSGGCNPQAEKPKKKLPVPAVALQTLEAMDFEQFLSLTATVEPRVTTILSSRTLDVFDRILYLEDAMIHIRET